jgi:hypothetical protein
MSEKKRVSIIIVSLALALAASTPAWSAPSPAVAILEMTNAGMDPRVDYLSGIVQGILAFDLGSRSDITLVDRRNLDAALKEKELSLSALGQDADAAAQAGKLVGADWLLSGEYVFLGSDVLLTLSLTETATAKRAVFRDRGSNENLVHKLAEEVTLRLTGKVASFADPGRARSLVSLRDETPGSVALFSPIIDAEVLLDGQFVAYTTGDPTLPLVLDKLAPGQHKIRVHLNSSFGVIKLPEVSFGDWEASFDIEANKRTTLRDGTRHFNETLYRLIGLGDGDLRAQDADTKPGLPPAKLAFAKELAFKDRKGIDQAVKLSATPRLAGGSLVVELSLTSGPKDSLLTPVSLSLTQSAKEEGSVEGKAESGLVNLSASLERRSGYWELEWSVDRTDIRQNMWEE